MIWILYGLLSAMFAALVAILGKKGLGNIGSLNTTLATTIRVIIMTLFLVSVSISYHKFRFISQVTFRSLIYIIGSGIAGALSWLCYFYALQAAPQTKVPAVAALDRLSVVFVLLFSVLFLGDVLTVPALVGASFVVLGVILMGLG